MMNPPQRLVLLFGCVAVLLATLFPPWAYQLHVETLGNPRITGRHGSIFAPPTQDDAADAFGFGGEYYRCSVWLDGPRFTAELTGILLVTIGLSLALGERSRGPTVRSQ